MAEPLVSIALATYNGAKYIREQLASIFAQTHQHLEVIVFDDGSTDGTLEILKEISWNRHNLIIHANAQQAGVVQNFSRAMAAATGDYIALCDQDDVWLPDKLKTSLARLQELEKSSSKETPALVFTDLKVVDENLEVIDASYWHHMGLNPENNSLNRALVENVATGCTILLNKATKDLALPIPKEALMHDVWLLLTASYFGQVKYLCEPTVLYRQHSFNAVGARRKGLFRHLAFVLEKALKNNLQLLSDEIKQAEAFHLHHQNRLSLNLANKRILEAFISLKDKGFLARKQQLIKYRFYRSSWKNNLSLLLRG
ncbi:glycosyltransferase family 2 protein [Rufibacter aurantiacus]|uniref:glycosyltransferase family 2 protein n=1 Tax=Rufibacter aurantiacus TaxID=2817374 RepID=UPI001B311D89|nr:glycosyltransferase family 2 protein [Rufibacter aurantiacus]